MRGGRSLLILLVVALGLGAYIYFVESERDPLATEQKTRVFSVEAPAIQELEIRNAAGEVTALKKTGDDWAIVSPVSASADDSAVDAVVNALAALEVDRPLEESPASLAPFGLDTPRLAVTFKTGDAATHRLLVGSRTPTGANLYAMIDGQPRLFLIMAHVEDTLNRTTLQLRDRRILTFDRASVDTVRVAAGGATPLLLARENVQWRLTSPIEARADEGPVDSLISRVEQAQMSGIVSEGSEPTPAELGTFGLATPRLTVTLGSASAQATLAIGADKDEDEVYARDMSRPIIFTVDPGLIADLRKTPDDLRTKDVFEFNGFSARGIDISHGGSTVAFAKSSQTGAADTSAPEVWSRTKPSAGDVNQTAMTDLLNTLSAVRVERFVSQAPARGDDMVVVARHGDSAAPVEERVTLRKSGDTAYAIKPGETGAGVIPVAEFDRAATQLQALLSPK